jgi:hypothetical protein
MKLSAVVVAVSAVSASAFAPSQSVGRPTFALNAEKKSLFNIVSDMDLFAPKKNQNMYGARNAKNLKQGKITGKSYVPAGLTAAQYEKVRNQDSQKKASNYQRNVAKAGKFQDYTDFYTKRGTDTSEAWYKSGPGAGHTFAKTKFDWSGKTQQAPDQVGLKPKGKK